MNVKQKFKQLSKAEKILVCIVFILIIGSLLFTMGKEIGTVIYKAIH